MLDGDVRLLLQTNCIFIYLKYLGVLLLLYYFGRFSEKICSNAQQLPEEVKLCELYMNKMDFVTVRSPDGGCHCVQAFCKIYKTRVAGESYRDARES